MWVEPDLMPLWLGDFRLVSTWQVGSELEVQGHLQGHPYTEKGTLLAFEPDKLLRYTHWSPLWGLPDLPGHHAVVTLRLVPGTEGTHLHFHHELPPVEALAEHSRFFWRVSLEQLKRVVEGQTSCYGMLARIPGNHLTSSPDDMALMETLMDDEDRKSVV